MDLRSQPLTLVVGAGGVGKTTLAASLGVQQARAGHDTLVATFDPSHRLKDALGVGEAAREREVEVPLGAPGRLWVSLLDARRTFDGLVARHAPDPAARDRILGNRFYAHLSSGLSGILEYMAVERLFEVEAEGRFDRVVLDTPPTRQALDFLGAPDRIMDFLDSGAVRIATRQWFDGEGRFAPTAGWGRLGRGVERYLDRVVGLDLLRDVAEFFQAFGPLYEGFRARAEEVKALLRSRRTLFVLVAGPGEEGNPDTLFFARKLAEGGFRLGPVVVNRVHPSLPAGGGLGSPAEDGRALLDWLARRDRQGLEALASLLPGRPLLHLPLLPGDPTGLEALEELGRRLLEGLDAAGRAGVADPPAAKPG